MSSARSGGGGGGPWPSKTNCADADNGTEKSSTGQSDIERIHKILNSVDSDLANRAASVVPDQKLRKECARELRSHKGSFRSRTVRGVLKAYLHWVTEQLDSEMVFKSDEGDTVKAPVPVSVSEDRAKEYYARIKDIERAVVHEGEDPHTAMLTFTGSTKNARGDPRCPVDHMEEVQSSWDKARRELDRSLKAAGFDRFDPDADDGENEKWYEYCTVLEPHKSGYAHFHVGVFASHSLENEMFKGAMDKHVEKCQIAGSEAHQVRGEDAAVSINEVDPSGGSDDDDSVVSNLGSYLAEYIGAFGDDGDDYLDRPTHEILFHSMCWATNRQRVRFSVGANRLSEVGRRLRDAVPSPSSKQWRLAHIERPDGTEMAPEMGGGVETVNIEGAESVDPPPIRS